MKNIMPSYYTSLMIYFSGFSPSDYFLFPNLKECLGRNRFIYKNGIISKTNGYFGEPRLISLFRRGEKIWETWDSVWASNETMLKNLRFIQKVTDLLTPPCSWYQKRASMHRTILKQFKFVYCREIYVRVLCKKVSWMVIEWRFEGKCYGYEADSP